MRFCISIAKSNAFHFMKQNQRTSILIIIDVLLLYNHRRLLILFGKNASILHGHTPYHTDISSKIRYFLLFCTKITMVYRLIFCNFLKKYLKFTLLWYPKLVFSTRSYQNYPSISVYIFISLEKTHQICTIMMFKNQIFPTYL